MTDRRLLPARRRAMTFEFNAGVPGEVLQHYIATLGFYDDGRLGEIFIHAGKTGSDRDIAMQEAAIAASFALQYGATAEAIRAAMPRTSDNRPEGPLGTLLDILVRELAA